MAAGRVQASEIKTVSAAWAIFRRKRAPRLIASAIVLALVARIGIGAFTWRDAAAVAFMAVVYPFGEWAIHVYLLHLRPFDLRGRRVDLVSARSHREHHESPQRLDLINFGPLEALAILLLAAPAAVPSATAPGAPLP